MIPLIKSAFYNEKEVRKELARFVQKADRFSMGVECARFEEAFAKKQGRKYAVMVNSGSSANLVLIQALLNNGTLKKGEKIGFSALTWATNIMPIIQLGLVPIPIDCEINTLNVSPKILEKHIKELDALFLTNVLGLCDDIEGIRKMCKKSNVVLLEDNCESLGSEATGKKLGNFGLASTFSFFIGHHLSTIEGGMVCTDDKNLYYQLLMVRAHGWDRGLPRAQQTELRKKNKVDDHFALYTFYDLAYNVRPTEINGFLGAIQIKHWDAIVSKREKHFKVFNDALKKNSDFIPLETKHMDTVSNFSMPVICKDAKTFEKYLAAFKKHGVEVRPIIAGDMTQQPFFKKYSSKKYQCPNAAYVHKNGFYFGNNPDLTAAEIKTLIGLLK